MAVRVRPKQFLVTSERHEDLIFVCDDPVVLSDFWEEIAPELPDAIHEELLEVCRAAGFHISMIDTGEWYLKWRVTRA